MAHPVRHRIVAALLAGLVAAGAIPAQTRAQDAPLPERRLSLQADTDLPGGDLGPVFDTTLQACVQTCLGDAACTALTYNERARACFPKGEGAGAPAAFAGAVSGHVLAAPPETRLRAQSRAAAAAFVPADMLAAAARQAQLFPALHPALAEGDAHAAAAQAEGAGDLAGAARIMAALAARDDRAEDWTNLARLTLYTSDQNDREASQAIALMALNGYLRAAEDAVAARALSWLAMAQERLDRGRDALAALRLAARLSPGDTAIASALQESEARNGLRVTDTQVESEGRNPRFCAVLSRDLAAGTDYAPFLRLPGRDLTVEPEGDRLCVAGLAHGQAVELTLRAGLPSADGEVLARDVTLKGYVRDREPEVRFPGRGYVLPASGDQRLTMVTVNADTVDLRLLRISDRNLIRAMSERIFAAPLDSWQVDYFNEGMAREVWQGQAQAARPAGQDTLNRELATSLAIPAEAGPLEPGIYVLQAHVATENPGDTGVAAQWFVISDFGISSFSGADGLTVAVRSLRDTSAKAGAEVALVSRSNEVLARAATDAEGIARFAPGLAQGRDGAAPALVTASEWQGEGADRLPRDMAFLSLSDPEFDLSDRGVEGRPPAPPIDIFLTTDRGAYRVGEVVNATALARDGQARALDGLPLTAVILRPDGVEAARLAPAPAGAGGATLAWTIPGDAPRGTWRLELRTEAEGPALASARLLVEDFLPERIDFAPRLPEGPARAGGTLDVSLTAHWLFGAPAANLPVEGTLRLSPARDLDGFAQGLGGYQFGRHDDETAPVIESLPPGTTDAQGNFHMQVALPPAGELGQRPILAEVVLDIREGAGRPVERSESRLVMPDHPVPGIRPLFEGDTVAENGEARFAVIALGPDLKPTTAPMRWVLNRIDTDYQWYSLGGQWNWEAITTRRRIAEGTAEPAATPDMIAAEIAVPVEWGQYELVAEPASGQGGAASVPFNAGWGAVASAGTETPDRLKVVLDRPAYRSGDTARVRVQAASDGLGLVSVLSNRLVSLRTVALTAGENSLDLPVTDDWGAGVYVTVSAIRPLGDAAPGERAPVRALGLAHAAVDPGERRLTAALEAPAESRPRGTIPVRLSVDGAAGETVRATVAAVDQGILNLTKFTPPDPSEHYFGQRRLGVGLRDLYGRLILPSGAPDGALRAGGDAMSASAEAPPPTERLMSWFSGPVTLDAQGQAVVEIPVGDFNGALRVMAVTWSDKGVGQADASVLVRDPVVMTVTAPAFLAPGDRAQVGLRLTHASGPAGEMRLAVARAGGEAALAASLPQDSVTLAEGAEARLRMPVAAGDTEGVAELRLTLTTPDGSALTKDIAIPVALNEADIQRRDRLLAQPGASLAVPAALTEGMLPGAGIAAAIGPFARLDVAGALMRLARYPFGCTEQLTSGALPLVYLPGLAATQGVGGTDTGKDVDQAIARILTRQGSNGGFGLWSADSGDLWLEAYVTDFLSRARAAGHAVPDTAFRQAIDNLRNRANYATEPTAASVEENAALAYALAVLARERAATVGDLRYYADTAAGSFATPMGAANLGAALALYGDQQRADRMFRQARDLLDLDAPEPRAFRADYGTALRDGAALLALAAEAGTQVVDKTDLSARIAQGIARADEDGRPLSTQEAVWTVMAAQALYQDTPPALLDGVALTRPLASLTPDAAIANAGDEALEVTLTATGKPAAPPAAGGRGYAIERRYFSIEGEALDPRALPQGTRMVAVIEVRPQAAGGGRLVVSDPLPAGWEIDNPNLLRAGDVSSLDWLEGETAAEMTEFRADRFAAALNWSSAEPFRLAYILRAVTPGEFRHPAASVEDMYRPEFRAWSDGGTVTVVP